MNEVTIYPYLKFESEREESLFHKIIFDADGGFLSLASELFFGGDKLPKFEYTKHENVFAKMYPGLERQVTFGTGKGGLEKWHTKKYTCDFFDRKNKIIYEIDGDSHKSEYQMLKDKFRDCFFYLEKNIKTVRVTNREVEEMLLERIRKLNLVDEVFKKKDVA